THETLIPQALRLENRQAKRSSKLLDRRRAHPPTPPPCTIRLREYRDHLMPRPGQGPQRGTGKIRRSSENYAHDRDERASRERSLLLARQLLFLGELLANTAALELGQLVDVERAVEMIHL